MAVEDVLQGLIDSMPGLAISFAVLSGAVGLAMSAFALLQIYNCVQNDEGAVGGWIVALICGCALTIVAIIAGKASLILVG